VLEWLALPYVQRGLIEVLLLAVAAGVLGAWIVLRGLAFYAHAVGTAAFPGLVLAAGLGVAAPLGAGATAALFAGGVSALSRGRRTAYDSLTALVLVGFLAVGVILASDVFGSGASVDTLLFGSLLLLGPEDLALAALASTLALGASLLLGPRWLSVGFDADAARALGVRSRTSDLVLLGLVALATTAALTAVGALLVSALFVVPAATVRLWARSVGALQAGAVALAAVEGCAGLALSVSTNAPPGATIAVLSGGVFAAAAVVRRTGRRAGALGAVAAALATSGCASSDGGAEGDSGRPLSVVATTTELGDFARQVGGPHVRVTQILQPNTDAHEYEPRPADVNATSSARVVLRSGAHLDDWMNRVVEQSGSTATVVDLASSARLRIDGEGGSGTDPHWWHDPRSAEVAVRRIAGVLAQRAPERRTELTRNAKAYAGRLRALDAGIRTCMAEVPARDRNLVTDHDAFNYFARRYRIRIVGAVIPSQTTQAQPSAGEVVALVETIERQRVRAVFPESSINPRVAAAIAHRTGVAVGRGLYGDSLGPPGSDGDTYLGMEAHNADAIVRGFTGGRAGCAIAGIE
jgi:ABC-type Zn uptake system ZnuABC Zn-binding protein ZnuA/ABC-type Mn2+/Zn2+ transport system permease subunit